MALTTGLQLRQVQRLSLTPGLRQSIAVLQMSAIELTEHIETELRDNPVLSSEPSQIQGSNDRLFQFAIDTVAQPHSLALALQDQINHGNADPKIKNIALYLSRNLTDHGYLADRLEEISQTLQSPLPEIESALTLLQNCDPPGIGARNLRECLKLQMQVLGTEQQIISTILDHLGLIKDRNFSALAVKTKQDIPALQQLLTRLNPKPADVFSQSHSQPLYPDVLVRPEPTGFSVELNKSVAPSLHVNVDLIARLKKQDSSLNSYLGDQSARANQLISAIDNRAKTLLRLTKALVNVQHRFFQDGPDHLIPLTLADLGKMLDLHVSTISRAMAGKSLSCKIGIFPLKFFMARQAKTADEKNLVSTFFVQQKIRKLIESEQPLHTLSDVLIAEKLRDNGVDIARRTVAKYRQCLKIPSSRSRRRSKAFL